MPKEIYCSRCGKLLRQSKQVTNQRIINVVFPHICSELNEKLINELAQQSNEEIEENEFIQKLNGLEHERSAEMKKVHNKNYGDRRPAEQVRKEFSYSTAPDSLRSRFKLGPKTKPDNLVGGSSVPDLEGESDA